VVLKDGKIAFDIAAAEGGAKAKDAEEEVAE
jgi:hypothetical protein